LRYVVMLELRDTGLLEQLDVISSVSGGSFTAAYYGLYGDRIFEDFEEGFLRRDAQGRLFRGLFNPFAAIGRWFGRRSRDEMAIDYYNEILCFTMPPLPI
jgi:NTE family protein